MVALSKSLNPAMESTATSHKNIWIGGYSISSRSVAIFFLLVIIKLCLFSQTIILLLIFEEVFIGFIANSFPLTFWFSVLKIGADFKWNRVFPSLFRIVNHWNWYGIKMKLICFIWYLEPCYLPAFNFHSCFVLFLFLSFTT